MKNLVMLIIAVMIGFAVFSFLNREPAMTTQSGGDPIQQALEAKSPFEQERIVKDHIARGRQKQKEMRERHEEFSRTVRENQAAGEERIRAAKERREQFNAAYGQ